jgi:ribonucleoside-diphosphate reductase alpha chain
VRSPTGEVMGDTRRATLMRQISEAAWVCGDPGMQFDTTINDWHTCPNTARINASNPCSEYMFLDDSACNLASLNLMKFYERGERVRRRGVPRGAAHRDHRAGDRRRLRERTRPGDREELARLPPARHRLREPRRAADGARRSLRLRRGAHYAAAITAIMSGESYAQSARIAAKIGPFDGYAENEEPFLRVIDKHRRSGLPIDVRNVPPTCCRRRVQGVGRGLRPRQKHGYRNAQISVLAPTGTIAFMMDCDTTGVEPDIALVKYKKLVGGGMLKIVNHTVPTALKRLGYDQKQINEIVEYIDENDTIEGAPAPARVSTCRSSTARSSRPTARARSMDMGISG